MLLKDNLSIFVEKAKANFIKDGFLTSILAAMIDGQLQIIMLQMENNEDKEAFSQRMQDLISKNRLSEYIMIVEAWQAEVKDNLEEIRDWLKTHGTLATRPDRKEIVSILYASAKEEIHYTADINRGIIPPVLDNWNTSTRKVEFRIEEFSSRFSGLFIRSKSGAN